MAGKSASHSYTAAILFHALQLSHLEYDISKCFDNFFKKYIFLIYECAVDTCGNQKTIFFYL